MLIILTQDIVRTLNQKEISQRLCRSFLIPYKDENGNYKWEGRFNQGVVTINLPQIGLLSRGKNEEYFWRLLKARLDVCFKALICRHEALMGTISDVSPIHWQYGGITRLDKGEVIDPYLENGYSTLSIGYIGLYEATKLMTNESHTTEKGKEFALRIMKFISDTVKLWKESTGLGFSIYGTPSEGLCHRFCKIDKATFGEVKDITDKGWYTNSFHYDVREKVDAFSKLAFEADFQIYSLGGNISYVELPNMDHNLEALERLVNYIYHTTQYAEFNLKSDCCLVCGYQGEITLNDKLEWVCPECGNKDKSKMNVVRRTCG